MPKRVPSTSAAVLFVVLFVAWTSSVPPALALTGEPASGDAVVSVAGTAVFDVSFGFVGASAIDRSSGVPLVTTPQGYHIALYRPAPPETVVEGSTFLRTDDDAHWLSGDGQTPGQTPEVSWTNDDQTNPVPVYDLDPGDRDFEFDVFGLRLGYKAGLYDSTNIMQRGLFSDQRHGYGQFKLQISHRSTGGQPDLAEPAVPECRFSGVDVSTGPPTPVDTIVTAEISWPDGVGPNTVAPTSVTEDLGDPFDISCLKTATQVCVNVTPQTGAAAGATSQTCQPIAVGLIEAAPGRNLQFMNKVPDSHSSDGCGFCSLGGARLTIADPARNPMATTFDNDFSGSRQLLVHFDGRLPNGADDGSGTSTRVYLDRGDNQNDMRSDVGSAAHEDTEYGTDNQVERLPTPVATDAGLRSLTIGARPFEIATRVQLSTIDASSPGQRQVLFAKGPSVGPVVKARVPDGSDVPECVFNDGAHGNIVVAAPRTSHLGVNDRNRDAESVFRTIACYRDSDGLGISVDGRSVAETPVSDLPDGFDGIGGDSRLVVGDDQVHSSGSSCEGCLYDWVEMSVASPLGQAAPWVGPAGNWTQTVDLVFDDAYDSGSRVVLDQEGKNHLTLSSSPVNWTDYGGAGNVNGVRFGAGGGAGSNGVMSNAGGLNPDTSDFRVQAVVKVDALPSQDVTIVRHGTTGQRWALTLGPDGRVSCYLNGAANAATVTSGVWLGDGDWHVVECARWDAHAVVVVDGNALTDAGPPIGMVGQTVQTVVANANAKPADPAKQLLGVIDRLRVWKGFS